MSNIIYQLLKQFCFPIFNIYYLLFVFQYSILNIKYLIFDIRYLIFDLYRKHQSPRNSGHEKNNYTHLTKLSAYATRKKAVYSFSQMFGFFSFFEIKRVYICQQHGCVV